MSNANIRIDLSTFHVLSASATVDACDLAPSGQAVNVTLTLTDIDDPKKEFVLREGWLLDNGFTDRDVADGAKKIALYLIAHELDERIAINGKRRDPHAPGAFADNASLVGISVVT